MRIKLRHRKIERGISHRPSTHVKIMMAWDKGLQVGLTRIRPVMTKEVVARTRSSTRQSKIQNSMQIKIPWAKNSHQKPATRPSSPSSISRQLSKAISGIPKGRTHHIWRAHQHQAMYRRLCLHIYTGKDPNQVRLNNKSCNSHKLFRAPITRINWNRQGREAKNMCCRTNQIPDREVSKAKKRSRSSKWSRWTKVENMVLLETIEKNQIWPSLKMRISQNQIKFQEIHKKGRSFQSKRYQTLKKL